MKKQSMLLLIASVTAMGLAVFLFASAYATTSFDFTQCANDNINGVATGPCDFIGSNSQTTKAKWWDGMAVPQRIMFNNITPVAGAGNVHTMTFNLQWTKGGVHAYDYLVSWGQARQLSSQIAGLTMTTGYSPTTPAANDPCENLKNSGASPTDYALCLGIHGGSGFSAVVTIPHDPFVSTNCDPGLCDTTAKETYFEGVYGARTLTIWGNAAISAANLSFFHSSNGTCTSPTTNDNGDTWVCFTLVYNSPATLIDVEVAPHIGLGCDPNEPTPLYWGCTHGGAAAVSGSPYHFANPVLDGVGGSQDNQIQVNNTPPIVQMVTSLSRVSGTFGVVVTDTVTITGVVPIAGTITFFTCTTATTTPCLAGTQLGSPIPVSSATSPVSIVSPVLTPPNGVTCFRVLFTSSNTNNETTNSVTTSGSPRGECITITSSTAVRLSAMSAEQSSHGAMLVWKTGSEVNTAGFNLYRAESQDGPYTRLNAQLIPATNSVTGNGYQYEDATAISGKTYYYQLEDVELNGKSTRHDPIALNAPVAEVRDGGLPLAFGLGLGAFALIASGLLVTLKKLNVF